MDGDELIEGVHELDALYAAHKSNLHSFHDLVNTVWDRMFAGVLVGVFYEQVVQD